MEVRRAIDLVAGKEPAISPSILPTVRSVDSGLSQLSIQPTRTNTSSSTRDALRRPAPLVTPTRTPEMIARELSRSPTAPSPLTRTSPPYLSETPEDKVSNIPLPILTPPQHLPRPSPTPRRTTSGRNLPSLATTKEEPEDPHPGHRRSASDGEFSTLPPSAWSEDEDAIRPAKLKRKDRSKEVSLTPSVDTEPIKIERAMSTFSQQETFEKMLFKNSAILCDL